MYNLVWKSYKKFYLNERHFSLNQVKKSNKMDLKEERNGEKKPLGNAANVDQTMVI